MMKVLSRLQSGQIASWQILVQKREASHIALLVALYAIALIGLVFVYWLNPVVALNIGDTYSLLLLLTMVGLGGLYFDQSGRWYGSFWSAWLAIFVLYTLVSAYVADMVLKHILFVMPLICISAALALNAIRDRCDTVAWQPL